MDSRVALDETDETINTQLNHPFELDLINHEGKQFLIVTSWKDKIIEAIDYKTGKIVWKIHGEFERKMINSHGISQDDIGNLYIAEGGDNKRILLVSPNGKIKQNMICTPYKSRSKSSWPNR